FREQFFLTFRHFMSPTDLLHKLSQRLNVQPGEGSSSEEQSLVRSLRPLVRVRTVAALKAWIDEFWSPDFVDARNRGPLLDFVRNISKPYADTEEDREVEEESSIFSRRISVDQTYRRDSDRLPHSPVLQPPPRSPKLEFADFEAKELAMQLTSLEHKRFRSFHHVAPLLQLWGDREDPIIAKETKRIDDIVSSFNQISYWVATEVCTQPELRSRARVLEKCIQLAKECRRLNNFNSTMAIVSGLNLSAVGRLKDTWEAQPKRQKNLQDLELLLNPQHNYRAYRTTLEQVEKERPVVPAIPILSLFLKDLFFINDGNPRYVRNDLVNFGKLRTMHSVISRMKAFQAHSYDFSASPPRVEALEYCRNLRSLKEAALYKYSLLCEAKSGSGDTMGLRDKWIAEASEKKKKGP
ncbi:ras guanine nucleotide exchange factor domain-containing protein, partial [Blyttiomyces helicus]